MRQASAILISQMFVTTCYAQGATSAFPDEVLGISSSNIWHSNVGIQSADLAANGWALIAATTVGVDQGQYVVTFWRSQNGSTARCLDETNEGGFLDRYDYCQFPGTK
ncbi:hypothetical protein [Psychromarinibacter sp. S121]|uniref:hypothetical protein n=1 Tax=Psychromarinibacter sp. S121 TaxID=3415127 RepID=UPI003C7ED8F1